jgi:hypothetical protein
MMMKKALTTISLILIIAALFFLLTLTAHSVNGQTADDKSASAGSGNIRSSGGQFILQKSAVAGGGSQMQQSPLTVAGTTGQSNAGANSIGGQFKLYSGFWTPDDFSPTAAGAVVGGSILTAAGAGIRNVRVTITFPSGESRQSWSSAFGYYRFYEVPSGELYTIAVFAKRYVFSEEVKVVMVNGNLEDIDFVASP